MKRKHLDFLLPLLLGLATMSSLVYCYSAAYVMPLTAGVLVYELLLFGLLHLLYNFKYKKLRGIIYLLALVAVLGFTFSTVYDITLEIGVTFSQWFYGISQEMNLDYLMIFIFGGGFVYISMLYYFTQVRYRSIMTLMLVLIPFAIYAKRLDVIRTEYLAAIILCYIAVMVHNRQTSADSGVTVIADRAYVMSISVFAVAVTALAVIIPKPEVKSLQEKDSNYLNGLGIFDISGVTTSFLGDTNISERWHGLLPSGEILFYAYSNDDIAYLKKKSYAYFEDNKWYYGVERYPKVEYIWNEPVLVVNGRSLQNKLKTLELYYAAVGDEENRLPLIRQTLSQISAQDDNYRRMFVRMEEGVGFSMFHVPVGTYSLDRFTDFTVNGEFTNDNDSIENYMLYYYSDVLVSELARKLDISVEEWEEIIHWYYEVLSNKEVLTDNEKDVYSSIKNELKYAQLHHNGEYDEYDENIRELALEITEGLTGDYEKAQALADYFTKAGYTYDLTYMPKDESIEYFIFDSKKGICTDFATAMTLMARSIGLTARYCEGYLAFEKDEKGAFVIRDSYAHAYVEVFIGGVGWTVFEPTVPGFEQMLYSDVSSGGIIGAVINGTGAFIGICVVVVLGILIIIFIRPISELCYRIYVKKLSKKNASDAVAKLYRRLVKNLSKKLRTDLSAYTVSELSSFTESFGVSSEVLCKTFEEYFYGGLEASHEQFVLAYSEYCSACKKIKKQA